MGWGDFFVSLPINHTWTKVDIIDNTVTAWNISPRFGYLFDLGRFGSAAVYAGTTWLDAEVDLAGRVVFDVAGTAIPGLEDAIAVDFEIRQRNKDQWNYLVGLNWELSRHWMLQAELGFGGSRENVIGSVTYRW